MHKQKEREIASRQIFKNKITSVSLQIALSRKDEIHNIFFLYFVFVATITK